jgi:hypothetical protein
LASRIGLVNTVVFPALVAVTAPGASASRVV